MSDAGGSVEHCYNWPNCDVQGPHSEALCHHPGGSVTPPLRIGDVLGNDEEGAYCGGLFGRDSYEAKRVEAVGADWVVVRDERGVPLFVHEQPEVLVEYRAQLGRDA
jgi:hypothetical protein